MRSDLFAESLSRRAPCRRRSAGGSARWFVRSWTDIGPMPGRRGTMPYAPAHLAPRRVVRRPRPPTPDAKGRRHAVLRASVPCLDDSARQVRLRRRRRNRHRDAARRDRGHTGRLRRHRACVRPGRCRRGRRADEEHDAARAATRARVRRQAGACGLACEAGQAGRHVRQPAGSVRPIAQVIPEDAGAVSACDRAGKPGRGDAPGDPNGIAALQEKIDRWKRRCSIASRAAIAGMPTQAAVAVEGGVGKDEQNAGRRERHSSRTSADA